MNSKKILVVLGTAREGRKSEKVANFIIDELRGNKFNVELLDIKDYLTEATVPSWQKELYNKYDEVSYRMNEADTYIFVVPEYNHSFPGEFKIFIDKLKDEPAGKSVLIAGVSNGVFGGARVVEHLLPVLVYFKMKPVMPPLYFGNVEELFDDNGAIVDKKYSERLIKAVSKL